MKVLMFGWEFPPINSGGLGTACAGLSKSLVDKNIDLTFVLPYASEEHKSHNVNIISAGDKKVKIKTIKTILKPYISETDYNETIRIIRPSKKSRIYGKDLFHEVELYAHRAGAVAEDVDHDVIHAHDWLSFKAGIKAKSMSGKPLIVHVHATEFDRTGSNGVNQDVYDIEKQGMNAADKVIAVSNFTKKMIIDQYGITPEKIEVVHNAVDNDIVVADECAEIKSKRNKTVLFLGRLTLQKGPDYFLYAAKKVLELDPNVTFVIAGSGDMEQFVIEKAAELGIARNVLFAGFVQGKDVGRAYRMADLYVMPSVSEPFGITPLEALKNNTPVLISKQSGVSEVLNHCLKVDFWNIDDMANKIISVLNYDSLKDQLSIEGSREVSGFNWDIPADKCINIYNNLLRK
ncbi:glycosyltransferase family 4 protein [Nanoarchaeota archaeon]